MDSWKNWNWKKQRMDHTEQYGPGPNLWGSIHVSCQDSLASLSWPEAGCAKASQVKMSKVSTSDTSIFLTMNIFNMHVLYDDVEMSFYVNIQSFLYPFLKRDQCPAAGGRVPCKPYGRSCPPWNSRNQESLQVHHIFTMDVLYNSYIIRSVICTGLVNMVKQ